MKAVILAGGKGTRMYPLTHHIPKPMVPIGNVPFIERMVRWLARHGVDDVVLSLGYLPDEIQDHFARFPVKGVQIGYAHEEDPLGTGGGIRNAANGIGETFLALNGDVLTNIDVSDALRFHKELGAMITIGLTPVENPSLYGVVETDDHDRIIRFTEKPEPHEVRSNMINAGLYVLEPGALAEIPEGVEYSIERELFPALLERGDPLYGYPDRTSYWLDIGSPEKYMQANFDVLDGIVNTDVPGTQSSGRVWVGEGTIFTGSVKVQAPFVIGRDCQVADNVEIGPKVVIGDSVMIDEGAVLQQCVIWPGTRIGRNARIFHAIIGRQCDVLPGVVVDAGAVHEDHSVIG